MGDQSCCIRRATSSRRLRRADHFTQAAQCDGEPLDPRVDATLELVRSRRRPDGTWLQEDDVPGRVWFPLDVPPGEPSKWVTFLALRALGVGPMPRPAAELASARREHDEAGSGGGVRQFFLVRHDLVDTEPDRHGKMYGVIRAQRRVGAGGDHVAAGEIHEADSVEHASDGVNCDSVRAAVPLRSATRYEGATTQLVDARLGCQHLDEGCGLGLFEAPASWRLKCPCRRLSQGAPAVGKDLGTRQLRLAARDRAKTLDRRDSETRKSQLLLVGLTACHPS